MHERGVAFDLSHGWIYKCLDIYDYFLTGVAKYQKLITKDEFIKSSKLSKSNYMISPKHMGETYKKLKLRLGHLFIKQQK